MKPLIAVTVHAWKKMEKILHASTAKKGFIYSVTSGGCNGFNFNLKLINSEELESIANRNPTVLKRNDTKLYIEPHSEMHLIGSTIDYITEDYEKGIYENKFIFNIDRKLASSCGCGVSFMPRTLK
jgi:iron-sulfur cluster assembly accessory protein